jgi:hypothetical protein
MEDIIWFDNFVHKPCLVLSDELNKLLSENKFINNIEVKIEELEVDYLLKMNEIKNMFKD